MITEASNLSQEELDMMMIGFKSGACEIDEDTNKILIPPDFMCCLGECCGRRNYCLRYHVGVDYDDDPNLCKKYHDNLYVDYELRVFLDNEFLLEQNKESYINLHETLVQIYETYEKDFETYRK